MVALTTVPSSCSFPGGCHEDHHGARPVASPLELALGVTRLLASGAGLRHCLGFWCRLIAGAAALGLACAVACCLALGAGADALGLAGSACLYLH